MSLTTHNLPDSSTLPEAGGPFAGACLHCWKCDSDYSASRGDYFWMAPTEPLRCSGYPGRRHRPIALQLVRRRTYFELLAS